MISLRSGSKDLIKEINRFKVLNIIRHKQPISRTQISKQCDLGLSTLSYIVEELVEQKLIYEVGEANSTGGRKAKLFKFNKDYGSIVSVKIEEEKVILALTNMSGELQSKVYAPFSKSNSPEDLVSIIHEKIEHIYSIEKKDISSLLGIGILSSGLVNQNSGTIIRSSILGWKNVPIVQLMKKYYPDVDIFIDNNINGYTLVELEKGEGKNNNNFLVVSVGAGLGLSIVIDRKIYYGAVGGAGEFGHTSIDIDGYRCHCGQKGCLEMYASAFYFENKGRSELRQHPNSIVSDYHFAEVAKCAEKGDALAIDLMKEMGTYLGHGVRNLINTFNPDKIIMVGEGVKYKHLYENEVYNIAHDNFFEKVNIDTEIVYSCLKDDAWFTGGALLAISQLFKEPIYEQNTVKL